MSNLKNIGIIISLLLISSYIKAQTNQLIQIGEKICISSTALNESRKIWVYNPTITSIHKDTSKKFPVLYVLDGDAHFYATVGIIQQLSQANGNGILPEMIIVGIENTNRINDLTPALHNTTHHQPSAFVTFLSNELMPFIESHYKTSPYKLIMGHSLGGLMVIDLLTNYPNLFNAYIAIDPSMWLKNQAYLNNSLTQLHKNNMNNKKLFVGIANTLPKQMSLSAVIKDTSIATQHIRSILKLDNYLKKYKMGLQYHQQYFANENHNSVPLLSVYNGLRYIFNYFPFNATEQEFADTTPLIANKIKQHYKNVSKEMNYTVAAPESFISYLGYNALSKKHVAKAKTLFEYNIENYPSSHNAYVAMGDFYATITDTANAILNYKKAMALKQDTATTIKLNTLLKKHEFSISLQELEKYAGTYTLEKYNINIILKIKENKLWAMVPGQKDDEFLPVAKDIFTVKGKQGYTITFEMKDNKPVSFTSVQPNGTFKAIYSNE
jgi:predicted alpha/beta superfamily hydrolase